MLKFGPRGVLLAFSLGMESPRPALDQITGTIPPKDGKDSPAASVTSTPESPEPVTLPENKVKIGHLLTLINGENKVIVHNELNDQRKIETRFGIHFPQASAQRFQIFRLPNSRLPVIQDPWNEGEFAGPSRIDEPRENWPVLKFSEDKFRIPGIYFIKAVGRKGTGWDEESNGSENDDDFLLFIIESLGDGSWIPRFDLMAAQDQELTLHP